MSSIQQDNSDQVEIIAALRMLVKERRILTKRSHIQTFAAYSDDFSACSVYKRRKKETCDHAGLLELMGGFEPPTSSLPRMRSTD